MDISLESGELGSDSPTNTSVSSLEEGEIRDSIDIKVTKFATVKDRLLKKLNFSTLSSENVDTLNISKVNSTTKVLQYLEKQDDDMDVDDEDADDSRASLSQTVFHITPTVARKSFGNVGSGRKLQGTRLEFSQPMPFVQKCQISERATRSLTPEKTKGNKSSSKKVGKELVETTNDIPSSSPETIVSDSCGTPVSSDATLSRIAFRFTTTPEFERKMQKKRKIDAEKLESGIVASESKTLQSKFLSQPVNLVQKSQIEINAVEKLAEIFPNEVNQEINVDIFSNNPDAIVTKSIQIAPEVISTLEIVSPPNKKQKLETESVESEIIGINSHTTQSELLSQSLISTEKSQSASITNEKLTVNHSNEINQELIETIADIPLSNEETTVSKLIRNEADLDSTLLNPTSACEITKIIIKNRKIETKSVESEFNGSKSLGTQTDLFSQPDILVHKSTLDETENDEIIKISQDAAIPSSNSEKANVTQNQENFISPQMFSSSNSTASTSNSSSHPLVNQELIETFADIPLSNSETKVSNLAPSQMISDPTLSQITPVFTSTPENEQEIIKKRKFETKTVESRLKESELLNQQLNTNKKLQSELTVDKKRPENHSNKVNQELIETIADIPSRNVSNLIGFEANANLISLQNGPKFTSTQEIISPFNKKQKIQAESVESGYIGSKSLGTQLEFLSQPVISVQKLTSEELSNEDTIKNTPCTNSEEVVSQNQEVFISSSNSIENTSTSKSSPQQPEKLSVLQKRLSTIQKLMKKANDQSNSSMQNTITQNTENFSLGFYTQSESTMPQPKQAVTHRRRYRPRHFVSNTIPIMAQDIPKVETVDKFLFCLQNQFFDKVMLYGKCYPVKEKNDKKVVYLLDDGTGKVIVHFHHQSKKILEEQKALKRDIAQIKSITNRTVSDYRIPLKDLDSYMDNELSNNEETFTKNTKVMVVGHFFHSKFSGKLEVSAEKIFEDNKRCRDYETLFKKSLNGFL